MYRLIDDDKFTVYLEEFQGRQYIHFECIRFSPASHKRLVRRIRELSKEMDSVYGAIPYDNDKMRRYAELLGFKHICNVPAIDGTRSLYILETEHANKYSAGSH